MEHGVECSGHGLGGFWSVPPGWVLGVTRTGIRMVTLIFTEGSGLTRIGDGQACCPQSWKSVWTTVPVTAKVTAAVCPAPPGSPTPPPRPRSSMPTPGSGARGAAALP